MYRHMYTQYEQGYQKIKKLASQEYKTNCRTYPQRTLVNEETKLLLKRESV